MRRFYDPSRPAFSSWTAKELERVRELLKTGMNVRKVSQVLQGEGIKMSFKTVARYKLQQNIGTAHPRGRPKNPGHGVGSNFSSWAKRFMRHDLTRKSAAFHEEMRQLAQEKKLLAIAAPRSFAKSTILTKHFALWRALTWKIRKQQRPENIIIVSETKALAEAMLGLIKRELTENKMLINYFGFLKTNEWRRDEIVLKNGSVIRARGKGSQTRGPRPTLVICDDLEGDEEVRSDWRRRVTADWFWKALFNTLEPTSQLIYVGTLLHPQALLTSIIQNPPVGFTVRVYKAIDSRGHSTWPDKWSDEELAKRRDAIGEKRFASEFLNDPTPTTHEPMVKDEWIRPYLASSRGGGERFDRVVMAVDPAIGKSHESDESGIAVFGVRNLSDMTRHSYSLSMRSGRWSVYELVREMINDIKTFRDKGRFTLVFESLYWMAAVRDVFVHEAAREGLEVPVKEIRAGIDKKMRLKAVTPFMEQGLVHFHPDDTKVMEQLSQFPYGKKDLADAAIHALKEIYLDGGTTNISERAPNTVGQKSLHALFPEISLERAAGGPRGFVRL